MIRLKLIFTAGLLEKSLKSKKRFLPRKKSSEKIWPTLEEVQLLFNLQRNVRRRTYDREIFGIAVNSFNDPVDVVRGFQEAHWHT